ncbi:MAG TPA: hypothetical protein VHW60_04325 [Caulobacteraceae bacterium]|jgi:DNA-binding CsgD family transcriptional regulator|nr:hypothetical protein [Caulobacteraceae bacterium]
MATGPVDGRFLEELYDAALHDGDWAPALRLSTELLNCAEVTLSAVNPGLDFVTYETTGKLCGEEARERYALHYGGLDPKLGLIAAGGSGYLFNDSAYFDDAFVARDPFYQEYTRWIGTRHTLDIRLAGEREAYFCAMRTAGQGPFQPASERDFARIAGHVGRVHALKARLGEAQARAWQAEVALDGLAYGLMALDGAGRAVLVNARARRLLAGRGELEWRHGRIAARAPAVDRELQALLERARTGADLAASSMRIPRADGTSWIVWIVRAPASSPLSPGAAPGVLIMIGDSEARGRVRQGDLIKIYALTPAEADLALTLGAGATLREVAAERGVSYATARSQLYAVLEKTGVHRQADLTRLIAGLPGAILDDPGS